MTSQEVSSAYAAKFDNMGDIAHPSFIFDPRFAVMMREAVRRGSPLTEAEVEAEFGPISWEW